MKIAVLANRDFAACSALNRLWPDLVRTHEVQLILSSKAHDQSSTDEPTRLDELQAVEEAHLLDPILSDSDPQEQSGAWLGFEELARATGRYLWVMNALNSEQELSKLADFSPDLILSIRYGVILKQPVLALPPHGVINLHSGQLPNYRGVMATFWAMYNGEQAIGTTLHYIDDQRIDAGRIIARTSLPVQPEKTYWWHVLELYRDGCKRMLEAVSAIASGATPLARPQSGKGDYYSFPSRDQLLEFEQRGLRLFDAEDVKRMGRVLGPPKTD